MPDIQTKPTWIRTMSSRSLAFGLPISLRPKPSFTLVLPRQRYKTPQVHGALYPIHLLLLQPTPSSRAHQNPRHHHPHLRIQLALHSSSRVFAGRTLVGPTIGVRSSTTLRARPSQLVSRFGDCVWKSCVASVGKMYLGTHPQN
jgi:hypothetical protein